MRMLTDVDFEAAMIVAPELVQNLECLVAVPERVVRAIA
jgi:hypothetical protein